MRKTRPEHDTEYKIGQQNFENQHQIGYRIWGFQGGVGDSNGEGKVIPLQARCGPEGG